MKGLKHGLHHRAQCAFWKYILAIGAFGSEATLTGIELIVGKRAERDAQRIIAGSYISTRNGGVYKVLRSIDAVAGSPVIVKFVVRHVPALDTPECGLAMKLPTSTGPG